MDIDIKELIKAAAEGFDLSNFKGDVVGVKIVENEIGNVEEGGIGVQKIYGGIPQKATEGKSGKKKGSGAKEQKPPKEREIMTFSRKSSVTDGHLAVLCEKQGLVDADYACKKWDYDPIKRVPKKQLNIPNQEDDII